MKNREEWERRGLEVVAEMAENAENFCWRRVTKETIFRSTTGACMHFQSRMSKKANTLALQKSK